MDETNSTYGQTSGPKMAHLQAAGHDETHNYVAGSPHLRHPELRARVIATIDEAVQSAVARQGSCSVLEVGAGHGTFTESVLASGGTATVTEMSRSSVRHLTKRFADHQSVTVLHDADGEEAFRLGHKYDVVLFISVLHHIPDYLTLLGRMTTELIRQGGVIVTYQDPLWYPRQSYLARATLWASYFAWRIGQGELKRGLATRWRHLLGRLDETNVSDMVEYHVVRKGVDDEAIRALLEKHFESVDIDKYWSTQSRRLQSIGSRYFPPNSFGLVANGLKPQG